MDVIPTSICSTTGAGSAATPPLTEITIPVVVVIRVRGGTPAGRGLAATVPPRLVHCDAGAVVLRPGCLRGPHRRRLEMADRVWSISRADGLGAANGGR